MKSNKQMIEELDSKFLFMKTQIKGGKSVKRYIKAETIIKALKTNVEDFYRLLKHSREADQRRLSNSLFYHWMRKDKE